MEPLPAADTAWLRMDSATNPMVVTALMIFDGRLTLQQLERVVRERMLIFERFRMRPRRRRFRQIGWIPDEHLAARLPIEEVLLEGPATVERLEPIVSHLLGEHLDQSRALWRAYLVHGSEGSSAVIIRIHHAVADGMILLRVLDSITEPMGPPQAARSSAASLQRRRRLPLPGWLHGLFDLLLQGVSLLRLLTLPADRHSALRGPVGIHKRASWTAPFTVESIKRAAHARGATVNDLLMAAVAGGVRRFLQTRGDPLQRNLRALIPVDLRGGDLRKPGNRFGLVFLPVPIAEGDRNERVARVIEAMNRLKRMEEAPIAYHVLQMIGLVSPALQRMLVRLFERKVSMIVTNVRGPTMRRSLAGVPLRHLLFWVPQAASLSTGISLFSYAGEVTIGVATDAELLPHPRILAALLEDELERLVVDPVPVAKGQLESRRERPEAAPPPLR